jgi:TnpA family transposase
VFALAYLLGIKLMPRIRNWQDLTLCRPDKQIRYDHIDELFTDVIDWKLIETHLSDMLRVVLYHFSFYIRQIVLKEREKRYQKCQGSHK